MSAEEHAAFWRAVDQMLSVFNSLDTEGMDGRTVRARLYGLLMELRP